MDDPKTMGRIPKKWTRYGVEKKNKNIFYNTIYYDFINRITIDEIIKINRYLQDN